MLWHVVKENVIDFFLSYACIYYCPKQLFTVFKTWQQLCLPVSRHCISFFFFCAWQVIKKTCTISLINYLGHNILGFKKLIYIDYH